jgi:hypothetical protein
MDEDSSKAAAGGPPRLRLTHRELQETELKASSLRDVSMSFMMTACDNADYWEI